MALPPPDPGSTTLVRAVESNLVEAMSIFGRWGKGELHEAGGCLWIATPIPALPYNGVLRTDWPPDADVDGRIREISGLFRARHVPMYWLVAPSTRPADLGERLARHGFGLLEELTGMAADLSGLPVDAPLPADVEVREVADPASAAAYVALMAERWHVPPASVGLLREFNDWFGYGADLPGRRWLAYLEGVPVGKAFLFLDPTSGSAGVYGVSTAPEARGRGIGTAVTVAAYRAARALGYRLGVLHSSPLARGLYRRLGFAEVCPIRIHAPQPSPRA